jgi:hypothetical protein
VGWPLHAVVTNLKDFLHWKPSCRTSSCMISRITAGRHLGLPDLPPRPRFYMPPRLTHVTFPEILVKCRRGIPQSTARRPFSNWIHLTVTCIPVAINVSHDLVLLSYPLHLCDIRECPEIQGQDEVSKLGRSVPTAPHSKVYYSVDSVDSSLHYRSPGFLELGASCTTTKSVVHATSASPRCATRSTWF